MCRIKDDEECKSRREECLKNIFLENTFATPNAPSAIHHALLLKYCGERIPQIGSQTMAIVLTLHVVILLENIYFVNFRSSTTFRGPSSRISNRNELIFNFPELCIVCPFGT